MNELVLDTIISNAISYNENMWFNYTFCACCTASKTLLGNTIDIL